MTPFLIGVGSSAIANPTTPVGQAPFVVWVDSRPCCSTTGDRRTWNFGDAPDVRLDFRHAYDPSFPPTVDLNSSLTGQVVGHCYNAPGTYQIVLTVTHANGVVETATQHVTVGVDTRTHYWISAAGSTSNTGKSASSPWPATMFTTAAALSNVYIHLVGPVVVTLSSYVRLYSNVVVEGVPDALGVKPTIYTASGGGLTGWQGQTQNVIVRGVTADGPFVTQLQKNVTTRPGSQRWFLSRGENVAVLDCDIGNLSQFVQDDQGDGFLVQGTVQLDEYGVDKQCISAFGGGTICWVYNKLRGSLTESSTRTDGATSAIGFTYEYNAVLQDPVVNGKACLTNRNGSDGVVHANVLTGAPFGASTTIHHVGSPDTIVERFLYTGNYVMSPNANGAFDIGSISDDITITGNSINTSGQSHGIHLGSGATTNVVMYGNRGDSNSAEQSGTSPAGLVSDIDVYNGIKANWVATPQVTPTPTPVVSPVVTPTPTPSPTPTPVVTPTPTPVVTPVVTPTPSVPTLIARKGLFIVEPIDADADAGHALDENFRAIGDRLEALEVDPATPTLDDVAEAGPQTDQVLVVGGIGLTSGGGISDDGNGGLLVTGTVTATFVGDLTGTASHAQTANTISGTIDADQVLGLDVIVGPAGPVGPQGVAGDPGAIGATGPQGSQGVAGQAGATGPAGAAGSAGAAGAAGVQGPTGATGPQGPAGTAGVVGATGATGPSGVISASGTAPITLTYNASSQSLSASLTGNVSQSQVDGLSTTLATFATKASPTFTGIVTGQTFSGSGAYLTNVRGASITGTIASGILGSGVASALTYLRGDGTWATPSGGTTPAATVVTAATLPAASSSNIGSLYLWLAPNYSSTVKSTSTLSTYWTLGDAVGSTTAADYENVAPLSVTGGVVFGQTGRTADTAVKFDGTSGRMFVTSSTLTSLLASNSSFSFDAWVNMPTPGSGNNVIMSFGTGSGGFNFGLNSSSQIFTSDVGVAYSATGNTALAANTWYHVGFTYSNGYSTLYLNGVSNNYGGSAYTQRANSVYNVGYQTYNNAATYYSGLMQDAALYSGVMPAATFAAHYANGTGGLSQQLWVSSMMSNGTYVNRQITLV